MSVQGLLFGRRGTPSIYWPAHDSGAMRAQVVGKYVGMGSSNEVARVRYITQVKARPPTFAVFTTAGETSVPLSLFSGWPEASVTSQ